MIIKMEHVRKARMCSAGARDFFKNHGLDYSDFLKNGVDSSVLLQTGDAMAIRVVEVASGRK